jgi:NADPH:quinone reductase-like Zn-dependent oxidoreductase
MNNDSKLEMQLDEGLEESFPASDSLAIDVPRKPLMHAVLVQEFGGLEALVYMQVPRPVAGAGQVLLRVKAAGVGPWDAWVRAGMSALPQPLPLILGADLAGIVEGVGSSVADFKPGDEVFGVTNSQFTGAYAEYALAEARMIALKPSQIGFLEAASIPVVAITAWQMLFDHGQVGNTKKVLIHGAAGNVGVYAVQLAKRTNATVVATAFTKDLEYVRSLGADEVIDATITRFDDLVKDVDVVIDTVGGETLERSFDVLKPGGILVSSVSMPDKEKAAQHNVRGVFFLVKVTTEGLNTISKLLEQHQLVTDLGEVLPLTNTRLAHEMLAGKPHKRGKIVLDISA